MKRRNKINKKNRKTINGMLIISCYVKTITLHSWAKFSNQKSQSGWIDKRKRSNNVLPTRDLLYL